jgi:glutaredoxin
VKIEVLYVPDCPHHPAAVRLLRDVLLAEGIAAEICQVAVKDAQAAEELRFRGSPTIRINGRDIAEDSHNLEFFGVACRVYPGAKDVGVPPVELMYRAVREARDGENV